MFSKSNIRHGLYLVLLPLLSQGCAEAVDNCELNACGSCGVLAHTPGDVCTNGVWACDNSGGVVCQSVEKNPCGGTVKLEHTPGESCPNGIWMCDGQNSVICHIVEKNPCGGTGKLALYGEDCGSCGKYQCDGTEALKCNDPGKNACGSCGALLYNPGDECDGGTWTCSNDGSLICKESDIRPEPNACGGTTEITEELGADCGDCGKYECAGPDAVQCNDPGKNACDGCGTLDHTPGDPCGECGQYICDTNESLKCDDPGKNACGGCQPLNAVPDTPCDSGECAKWTCDGTDNIICGSNTMNACGGCDPLEHEPGEQCEGEECCTWVCDDHGGVIKDAHVVNACGGCGILDHDPATECENGYGLWECDTADSAKNSLKCVCDEHNVCGGCNQDKAPGDNCTMCKDTLSPTGVQGHVVCKAEALTCSDDSDTPETAVELSKEEPLDDGNDNIQKWGDVLLEDESDIDWYYIQNVKDSASGLMQPQFWILDDAGYKLCAYILEDRSPASVDYKCSGTGKDDENALSMTVSATEPAEIELEDGRKYTGFCTKPSSDSSYKFIKFADVETPIINNSLSVYISVSSDGTRKDECRSYTLRYRF